MTSVAMVLQMAVPLAASGIALAVMTLLVKRFGAKRSDTWRALVVTAFVVGLGLGTFFAVQTAEEKMPEDPLTSIMTFQWVAALAASGITFVAITILANRFVVVGFGRWNAPVVTTFVAIVGCVTFFGVQAVASKMWEDAEAEKKSWTELVEDGDYDHAERRIKGEFELAESRYKQAIAILEIVSPSDLTWSGSVATEYARMLRETSRDSEADAILERVNTISGEEIF